MPLSGFELATQWSEAQHATAGLRRPPSVPVESFNNQAKQLIMEFIIHKYMYIHDTTIWCRYNFDVRAVIMVYMCDLLTRLLGRPQPQMYPPVALSQYTWVNRTHKQFYIYMLQDPTNILKYISHQSYPLNNI